MGADPAVRISLPAVWAEVAGAVLGELLGPFQELEEGGSHHLVFYPFRHGAGYVPDERIRAALPADAGLLGALVIERVLVPGGWEEGWKDHFPPIAVGRLYVRPPWEEPPPAGGPDVDIVLSPGLAFGTGLHPTTRGVLSLLQTAPPGGPFTDVGTGSGILFIAAGKLGFSPVRAFDNDPQAVTVARANTRENGVEVSVELYDLASAPREWFDGATILANLTSEPVMVLIARLTELGVRFPRLLVSGIMAGEQEADVVAAAIRAGLEVVERIYETEWVSMDLRPPAVAVTPAAAGGA